jgi:hypothetical protein
MTETRLGLEQDHSCARWEGKDCGGLGEEGEYDVYWWGSRDREGGKGDVKVQEFLASSHLSC